MKNWIRIFLYPALLLWLSLTTLSHGDAPHHAHLPGEGELLIDRQEKGYQVRSIRGWEVEIADTSDAIDAYFSHHDPMVEINIIIVATEPEKVDETRPIWEAFLQQIKLVDPS